MRRQLPREQGVPSSLSLTNYLARGRLRFGCWWPLRGGAALRPLLTNLAATFAHLGNGDGNSLVFHRPLLLKGQLTKKIRTLSLRASPPNPQYPRAGDPLAPTRRDDGRDENVAWGKTLKGYLPSDLSVVSPGREVLITPIGRRLGLKNTTARFGVSLADRRRHLYIVGKTGAGKSTLVANMAIANIRAGHGVGIIDPHGDLCKVILSYIPKRRIHDVVYLEPFDSQRPFSLNILEVKSMHERDVIASGIVAIFAKLYHESWGPRLEYLLRNVILTLLERPGSTLVDVLPLLGNERFRADVVSHLTDPILKAFWKMSLKGCPDRLRAEAISPIQNKVGQFVQSRKIRAIIGRSSSTLTLRRSSMAGKFFCSTCRREN